MPPSNNAQITVNLLTGELSFNRASITLQDKSIALLVMLSEADNQTLTRDVLLDQLWPDTVVSDDSLTNLISVTRNQLSKVQLRDLVRTLPKKGYSLSRQISIQNQQPIHAEPAQKKPSLVISLGLICAILITLMFILSVNQPDDEFTLAIMPTTFTEQSDAEQNLLSVVNEKILNSATDNQSFKVLSSSEVQRTVDQDGSLASIEVNLQADYILETQLRVTERFYILNLQLVDATNQTTVTTSSIPLSVKSVEKDGESAWIPAINLFLDYHLFNLGIYTESNDASLCQKHDDLLAPLSSHVMTVGKDLAEQGIEVCQAIIAKTPDGMDAYRVLLDILLDLAGHARKDQPEFERRVEQIESIIAKVEGVENTEELVATAKIMIDYYRVRMLTNKDDPDALYAHTAEIMASFNEQPTLSPKLGNLAAIMLHRYASHLARKSQDPFPAIEQAESLITKALVQAPNNDVLLHTSGRVYLKWGTFQISKQQDPTATLMKAVAQFRASSKLSPDYYQPIENIANVYAKMVLYKATNSEDWQSPFEQAIKHYNQSLAMAPNAPYSYNNKADLYATVLRNVALSGQDFQHYYAEAVASLNTVIANNPDYTFSQKTLTMLYHLNSGVQWQMNSDTLLAATECVDSAQRALSTYKKDPVILSRQANCHRHMADYYLSNGQYKEAEDQLALSQEAVELALSESPDSIFAHTAMANLIIVQAAIDIRQQNDEQAINKLALIADRMTQLAERHSDDSKLQITSLTVGAFAELLSGTQPSDAFRTRLSDVKQALGSDPVLEAIDNISSGKKPSAPQDLISISFRQYAELQFLLRSFLHTTSQD